MDQYSVAGYRHRRSPSSDRFMDVFSPPSAVTIISSPSAGDELSEIDVFYTSDSPAPPRVAPYHAFSHRYRHAFASPEKFGILAALPEDRRSSDAVVQKPSIASPPAAARDIPSIPKPQHSSETNRYSQSMPIRRFQQSAPVKIPMMPRRPRTGEMDDVEAGDNDADDEEVLPPHEIVARGSMRNQTTTFSVLEGVGRTLKGRDQRRVRNAVWRQTGFLE